MVNAINLGVPKRYLFVVDTDAYAGNFEREMCAYMTGQIGECGVGGVLAALARVEIPNVVAQLEDLIEQVPDEHGCHRPVSILPNPRYGNDGHGNHALLTEGNKPQFPLPAYNGLAIYFHSIPPSGLMDSIKARAKKFASGKVKTKDYTPQGKITIEGFRLLEQQTVYKEL